MKLSTLAKQAQYDTDTQRYTVSLPIHSGDTTVGYAGVIDTLALSTGNFYVIGDCVQTMTHTHKGKQVTMPFDVYARLEEAFTGFHADTRPTWQRLGWHPISYELTSIRETRTCWILEFEIHESEAS